MYSAVEMHVAVNYISCIWLWYQLWNTVDCYTFNETRPTC